MSQPVRTSVCVSDDALAQLAHLAQSEQWPRALVVMDANTEAAAGRAVVQELGGAGIAAGELVFERRHGLQAREQEISRVREQLDPGVVPVAVGSGVITDIVRYAAHQQERAFVSVVTAASMDGYASSVAALQCGGVKVTLPARAPRAIFADPRVAAAAPAELTRAGVGDLLGKATARVDWLAAHLLCGEPFSDQVAARVLEPLELAVGQAPALVGGDPAAVTELLHGLLESGLAMAIWGNSRPASGCEHHASHIWDLFAARGLRAHASHGLQVGYATRFAIRLQRFAFAGGVATLRSPRPPSDPLGPAALRWLGQPSPEIVRAVAEKERFIVEAQDTWPQDDRAWADVRSQLAPALARFDDVERALDVAAIPAAPGYLELDERTLRASFHFASRLRARYTTIDFLEGQHVLDRAVDEMLPGSA